MCQPAGCSWKACLPCCILAWTCLQVVVQKCSACTECLLHISNCIRYFFCCVFSFSVLSSTVCIGHHIKVKLNCSHPDLKTVGEKKEYLKNVWSGARMVLLVWLLVDFIVVVLFLIRSKWFKWAGSAEDRTTGAGQLLCTAFPCCWVVLTHSGEVSTEASVYSSTSPAKSHTQSPPSLLAVK